MNTEKLKLVIVGHVDHGKSSLIGRLLFDTNSISPDKMAELKKVSQKAGKEMEFAFLLDHLQEEREQGITIDTTQTFFKSDIREFVIIDAPGHVEFVKNMVTGASQAEAAILIIDANEKIQEQTKRHAFILSLLGIEQIVVVINKMDLVGFKEDIYNEISCDITEFLKTLNLKANCIIPISALLGDNVAALSGNMVWYEGRTVLQVLNTLKPGKSEINKPCILPVQDVYKIGDKRIAVGRVETGSIQNDMEITVYPTVERTAVKTIERFLEDSTVSAAGDSTGVTTMNPVFLERGSVICTPSDEIRLTVSFKASVFWMSKASLKAGEKVLLRCTTQEMPCEIESISRKLNSSTLEYIDSNMDTLNNLEVGEVVIKLKKNIVAARFKDIKALGRFVLVKDNNISAGGIITDIN
ncbi:MAG TPA: GTP-binding protein [Ruminiclostridium sp.]|nr:GTP-binding protein [Ruminiclostridium sp.]